MGIRSSYTDLEARRLRALLARMEAEGRAEPHGTRSPCGVPGCVHLAEDGKAQPAMAA